MSRPYLFVINSLAPGGAERSLVELLPRLRASGIRPIVVCLYRRDVGFEPEVVDGGFELRLLTGKHFLSRVRELRRMIRTDRPALVHTTLYEADLVGRVAAAGSGVPVISTLANTTYDPVRLAADANLNRAKVAVVRAIDGWTSRHLTDHFHAVSGAVKNLSVQALGIDPDSVTVVYRGRDPARLGTRSEERREMARTGLGLGPESELILTVGRNEFQKGQEYLIRAFGEFASVRPDARVAVAGRSGNSTAALRDLIKQLDLTDRVMLLGHRSDVSDLLVAADVFVFPSLWEGLGGAVIEALALQVPIVASDLPALREVVIDGENGVLVNPGDVSALAEAVQTILEAPSMGSLVSGNRDRFVAMFDIEARANEMIDLLRTHALAE